MNNSWEKKKKKANYRGSQKNDPRRSKRRLLNTCEYSQAATREGQRGGERQGGGIKKKKKRAEKQESNSDFTLAHAERARCGNGDICSLPVVVPGWWPTVMAFRGATGQSCYEETSELNCFYMHTHIHTLFCEFIIRICPSLLKMDSSSSSPSPPVTPPVSLRCLSTLFPLWSHLFPGRCHSQVVKSLASGRTSFPRDNHLAFRDSDAKIRDC